MQPIVSLLRISVFILIFSTITIGGITAAQAAPEKEQPSVTNVCLDSLKIFGPDSNAMRVHHQYDIQVACAAPLTAKLKALAQVLSERHFAGLPVVILRLEQRGEKQVAFVDLREKKGLVTKYGHSASWSTLYFQGSSGGAMTTGTLVYSFWQKDYTGEWIDGVRFLYEGKPPEEYFEHVGFDNIHWRKH